MKLKYLMLQFALAKMVNIAAELRVGQVFGSTCSGGHHLFTA